MIFGAFLVGTGEPMPYYNKITLLYGCGLKKLGLGQKKKKPSLGQNPNFGRKFVLNASLMRFIQIMSCLDDTQCSFIMILITGKTYHI